MEIRSSFNGVFNYHLGSKWTNNAIKTIGEVTTTNSNVINNISFLDLYSIFSKKLDSKLSVERYSISGLGNNNGNFCLIDFEMNYQIHKNRLNLSLIGKNLLDLKKYETAFLNEYSNSITSFDLRDRYFLLKVELNF